MTTAATTYRQAVARAMSEGELMGHITTLCQDLGLLAYHTHNSRRSTSGYPDWHIVGNGRSILRECKTEKGRVTPEQQQWITKLRDAGHDVGIWRPRDLMTGQIGRELAALARRSPPAPA